MSSESPYEPPPALPTPGIFGPPPLAPNETDLEHLRWLSIGYYVFAGLATLGSCFGLIYLGMGIVFMTNPQAMASPNQPPPPPFMGGMFAALGVGFMAFAWSLAVVAFLSARWLGSHRYWLFCVIVSCVSMLCQPLGTILGIFTLIVLLRPSVRALFQGEVPARDDAAQGTPNSLGGSPFAS